MAGRFFFAAALIAVHSFTPAISSEVVIPSTITTAPKAKRTPNDLGKRQAASTPAVSTPAVSTPTASTPAVSTPAASTPLPLTQYHFPYSALPEKINPIAFGRGPQSGINRCNSTTEGPDSECQTIIFNSLVCSILSCNSHTDWSTSE